jgi:hypothetical protein
MDWSDAAKNFGPLGLVVAALFILARDWMKQNERAEIRRSADTKELRLRELEVEEKKADGFVSALTAIGMKVDAHHTADIKSHADLSNGIAELHGKVDEALSWQDRTPVGNAVPKRVTPARGVPAGEYGFHRPRTRNDGDR